MDDLIGKIKYLVQQIESLNHTAMLAQDLAEEEQRTQARARTYPIDPFPSDIVGVDLIIVKCGAVAIACMPQGASGECTRDAHDHEPCRLPYPHLGRHSWQLEAHDNRVASDPHAPPPATYALPGMPPLESLVTDRYGAMWLVETDRALRLVDVEPGERKTAFVVGTIMSWSGLLEFLGPLTLSPETEAQRAQAALYGPPGARWGNPDLPCDFYVSGENPRTEVWGSCIHRFGHAGPHINYRGEILGATEADGTQASAGISPAEASETPCTCGHPDHHQPTCPRHQRMQGPTKSDTLRTGIFDMGDPEAETFDPESEA